MKKRRQYRPDSARSLRRTPGHFETDSWRSQPSKETSAPRDKAEPKERTCWNCGKTGHFADKCRAPKTESTGRFSKKAPISAKRVQSGQPQSTTEGQDDPRHYLLSDSDDSDAAEVRQVRVLDRGSKPQRARVLLAGVPISGVVDSGADITILGGEAFKQVAAVAKLRKREFKPPDKKPRNYDQQPFRLDGRFDLNLEFRGKAMKTPIYVKMDATEPLLLSEGVCRQLGIITYHPEVHPGEGPKEEPPPSGNAEVTECRVPTVRVRLVESLRLLPNETFLATVQLVDGELQGTESHLLFEPDPDLHGDRGVQISDAVIRAPEDGITKLLLSNCLGFTQRVEEGLQIGTASRVEVIDRQGATDTGCVGPPEPDVVADADSDYFHPGVKRVTTGCKSSPERNELFRRSTLRETLGTQLVDSLPEDQSEKLCSLLEEYNDVFCLEEGERGETDLVEMHIVTGDASPRRQPVRRVPFAVRQEVARQLRLPVALLKAGKSGKSREIPSWKSHREHRHTLGRLASPTHPAPLWTRSNRHYRSLCSQGGAGDAKPQWQACEMVAESIRQWDRPGAHGLPTWSREC